MPATIVQGEPGAREASELGLTSKSVGKLQVPVPAAAQTERHKHVYSADASLRTDGDERVGRCCVTIHEGFVLGILPADQSAAPLWFKVPVSDLSVATEGQKGAFKKRPALIVVDTEGFSLRLSDVDQLFLARGNYQAGREADLLAVLQG